MPEIIGAPKVEKQFLFYVQGRHPQAKDIYDKNFFLVGAPGLGDVNYEFFSRASDPQKWAMLVHSFECFINGMNHISQKLDALEKNLKPARRIKHAEESPQL